jgi:ferredoxin
MPTVRFRDREINCTEGETLRNVLLDAGLTPHNGKTEKLNCRGFATCGTCAVGVDGEVSEMGAREKVRLLTPPHHPNYDLRLSCQTKVLGDVTVEKYPGNWGTQIAKGPLPPVDETDSNQAEAGPLFQKESVDEPTK